MWLLKKDTPFVWDEQAQNFFEELNSALTNTRLLSPPNYNKDFLLYLVTSDTTIGMVLVQTDDQHNKHVIYLISVEFHNAHVEKLALVAVIVLQCLRHYILLRTTKIVSDTNPMQYILSCKTLGGKYSKWIVILQEFDLVFITAKAKKSLVFTELIIDLPQNSHEHTSEESVPDESLFLIESSDP